MLNVRQILVSAVGLVALGVALAGCGQTGSLFLPTDPAAANRATLPESLMPGKKDAPKPGDSSARPADPASPAETPATGAPR